jgi:hypothetical protein
MYVKFKMFVMVILGTWKNKWYSYMGVNGFVSRRVYVIYFWQTFDMFRGTEGVLYAHVFGLDG